MRRLIVSTVCAVLLAGCAGYRQQLLDVSRYTEEAHAFCPMNEDPDDPREEETMEIWVYIRPLETGAGDAVLLKARKKGNNKSFLVYREPVVKEYPELLVRLEREGYSFFIEENGKVLVPIAPWDILREAMSVFTSEELKFLQNEKALRRCIIANKIREPFDFD